MWRATTAGMVLGAVLLLSAPHTAQAKTTWDINTTVVNNSGSQADNCVGATGVGCIIASHWIAENAGIVSAPTSPIPSPGTGAAKFTAPETFEGADMYIDYTMPDGSAYYVTLEDDLTDDDGINGNYAACTESTDQGSDIVCSAAWGGSYWDATPTLTFGPSTQAPLPSAGQRCSGQMGGSDPVLVDCTATRQVGPPDANNPMVVVFETVTDGPMYVKETSNGFNCRLGQGYGSTCTLQTYGGNLQIGSLDNGSSATYTVEVIGTADGPAVPIIMPTYPGNTLTHSAPQLSALSILPTAVRPVRSGRAAGGRTGATLTYRSTADATTVFTLERAGRGAGWVTLGHDAVQSTFRRSGGRRPVRLRGHFLHRGNKGRNVVRFSGRLAGRRLGAGRYRVTARARTRRTGLTSRPVRTQFRVRR